MAKVHKPGRIDFNDIPLADPVQRVEEPDVLSGQLPTKGEVKDIKETGKRIFGTASLTGSTLEEAEAGVQQSMTNEALRESHFRVDTLLKDIRTEVETRRKVVEAGPDVMEGMTPEQRGRFQEEFFPFAEPGEEAKEERQTEKFKLSFGWTSGQELSYQFRLIKSSALTVEEKTIAYKKLSDDYTTDRITKAQKIIQQQVDYQTWLTDQVRTGQVFGGKMERRLERGMGMVVSGGFHLLDEINYITSAGQERFGRELTPAELARRYHQVLERPEIQAVVDNWFDKYIGGTVESGPFMVAAMAPAVVTHGAAIPSFVGGFLAAYAVEGNAAYQAALDRKEPEYKARIRGVVVGLVNGGIELSGGPGKYYKDRVILNTMNRLQKARRFSVRMIRNALREGIAEEIPQELSMMVLGGDAPRNADGSINDAMVVQRLFDAGAIGTIAGGMADVGVSVVEFAMTMPPPKPKLAKPLTIEEAKEQGLQDYITKFEEAIKSGSVLKIQEAARDIAALPDIRSDEAVADFQRAVEAEEKMPLPERLTKMPWRELQREARQRGIAAFQNREQLVQEILIKEGVEEIPLEERIGQMSWQELQNEARSRGINAFQKRSKVVSDILGQEAKPEAVGVPTPLTSEEVAAFEEFLSGMDVPELRRELNEWEAHAAEFETNLAKAPENAALSDILARAREKIELIRKRLEGEGRQPAKVEPVPPPKPLPGKLPADVMTWAGEAADFLIQEDFEFEEGTTPADLVGVLGDYRRLLREVAAEKTDEGEIVKLMQELEDLDKLIRRGELLTGARDIDVTGRVAGKMLARPTIPKTRAELEQDAAYWQQKVSDLWVEQELGDREELSQELADALAQLHEAEDAINEAMAIEFADDTGVLLRRTPATLEEVEEEIVNLTGELEELTERFEGTRDDQELLEDIKSLQDALAGLTNLRDTMRERGEERAGVDKTVEGLLEDVMGEPSEEFTVQMRQTPDDESAQVSMFMDKAGITDDNILSFQKQMDYSTEEYELLPSLLSKELRDKFLQFMTDSDLQTLMMHMGDVLDNEGELSIEEYRPWLTESIAEILYGPAGDTGDVEGVTTFKVPGTPMPPKEPPAPPAAEQPPSPEPEPPPPPGKGPYEPPSQQQLNETNDELLAKLSEVKRVRKDEELPAIKKMRKKQIARALGIQEAAEVEGVPAADVIRRSKGGYKVTADTPQYTPIALTNEQWDAYSRQVYNVYVGPEYKFQQTAAQDALDALKDGRIITDAQAALLVPVMGVEMAEEIASTMEKLGDKYQRFWNLSRDLVLFWKMPFNFDVQFTRNAVNFVGRHPVKYVKGTYEALRSFASKDYTNTLIQATRSDPAYAEAEAYGMPFLQMGQLAPLGKLPEQFRGRLPYRMSRVGKKRGKIFRKATTGIRMIGKWQLAAERSFVASANYFMLDLWKTRQKQWDTSLALLEDTNLSADERERIKEQVDKHKKNYADVVGNYIKIIQAKSSTGRAIQTAANFVLWSPSMTWSRFRRPEMMLLKTGSRAYAMSIEATSVAKIFAVGTLLTLTANYFRDDDDQVEVELDPRSTNWGRFKEGDTWYDFGGGEIQHYRTIAQFVTESIKTQSGRIVEIPREDLAKNYVEGRETALIGIFHEILTGESLFGQKVWAAPDLEQLEKEGTVTAEAYAEAWRRSGAIPGGQTAFLTGRWLTEHLMPASLTAFAEASITDGWPQAVAAGLTEAMAMSAQSYKQRASAELAIMQDELAQAYHKKKWDELTPKEQNAIRDNEPPLHDVQISMRKEQQRWAQPQFERREEQETENQLFDALSDAVKDELESFGLTAGTVGRRFGPTDAPFYLNEPRFEEYVTITKAKVQEALDQLIGSTRYRGKEKKDQEADIQAALSKAKLAARDELLRMINTGEI